MVAEAGFDSVTQYELWKATWSALNDGNFHELDHALQRHNGFLDTFVPETFIGNHDVTRMASTRRTRHVAHALVLLMTTGGVPTIYAGDELDSTGSKRTGRAETTRCDPSSSPPMPVDHAGAEIFALHQFLIGLRRRHPVAAHRADNRQYIYGSPNGYDALILRLR